MAHYTKTYSEPSDLIALLKSRGMTIDNEAKAQQYLKRIGYYRMSAYFYPLLAMPKEDHQYKVGSTFRQALDMYRFDRQLRLLIFNQIEKIEVAVRSAMVSVMSRETGDPFWMTNPVHFANSAKFNSSMQKIQQEYNKSREDFIEHFRNTYDNPFPPSWMLAEILPLGVLTRIYENIKVNQYRKKIAKEFDLNIPVFTSWMTIITVTRNNCCHHARIWNRVFTLRALLLSNYTRPWISSTVQQGRIFYTLCIIKYLMDAIVPNNDMASKLRWLFIEYPNIDLAAMGFPKGWEMEPIWQ
ncbi:MAG: Abi family protein [Prevotellaceae bacterium]|nr:Abi family protein [Prevotellaceae bacterium]